MKANGPLYAIDGLGGSLAAWSADASVLHVSSAIVCLRIE